MLPYPDASRALATPVEFPDESCAIRSFSIDTRTLREGELFIALPGERSDGHDHVIAAFRRGASGALVQKKRQDGVVKALRQEGLTPRNILAVEDPAAAMASLARHYRDGLSVKTIVITGSVGKTTTKEFLHFLLKQKYPTLATEGNLNNHLGVPIMISRIKPDHAFAVLEAGASHAGEIDYLASMIRPMSAILTPIGPAHLQGFGTLENVYRAKTEVLRYLSTDSPMVVPDHDERLHQLLRDSGKRFIRAGSSARADYHFSDVRVRNGMVRFKVNETSTFSFPGQASFLALNATLAIALADQLGVSIAEMPSEWADLELVSGRFCETVLPNGIRVIDDSYNASPLAFATAIEAFRKITANGKKILVFADMLELGADEVCYHREIGEKIALSGIDAAYAFGDRSRNSIDVIRERSREILDARHFSSADDLVSALGKLLRPGDLVLLKGSRGMRVEKVLAGIERIGF